MRPSPFNKNQAGQVQLVITLVVSVISLVLGAAVTQRAVSNLKQTTYTAQAAKAQKAADAGAEEALGVADLSTWLGTHSVNLGGGSTASYTVAQSGGGSDPIQFSLDKDQTQQLNLTNTQLTQARISWNGNATVVYSVIHKNSSGVVTIQQKGASDPNEADSCSLPSGTSNPSVTPGTGYDHQIVASGLSIGAGEELYIRIRPLCETNVSIQVEGLNASGSPVSLPTQGYTITSTGTYGEAQWTVEVTKMNPALPAIFDYAIFSEGDLQK